MNNQTLSFFLYRGSYPPLPPCYSRELRQLVDSCLKNRPRDRPSINSILRLPFIQQRIERLLSETVNLVLCIYFYIMYPLGCS